MPLETGTTIADLNASNPAASDGLGQADDHLRLIKSLILATFPNITAAITATAAEINELTAGISASRIGASAVTTAKINDLAVTAAKLAADAVETAKIKDLNVTTGKLNDLAVTAGKLAADAVTTAKILDLNVTTAKINDLAVTTGKINDLAVTAGKLAADAVTTAKLLDANVTSAKLAADVFSTAHTWSGLQTFSHASGVPAANTLKAFGSFTVSGSTVTFDSADAFNVSGVVRNSTGSYTVTFGTAFADTDYVIIFIGPGAVPGSLTKNTGDATIRFVVPENTGIGRDVSYCHFMVMKV